MPTFFVDVDIPMYAAGAEHPLKKPCSWALEAIVEGRFSAAIDAEIVQEILYRYGALNRRGLGARVARDTMAVIPTIYPVNAEDVSRAVDLFEQYDEQRLPARDCLHAAVMLDRGLSSILSTDSHFDAVAGLTRVDPMALFREQGPGF